MKRPEAPPLLWPPTAPLPPVFYPSCVINCPAARSTHQHPEYQSSSLNVNSSWSKFVVERTTRERKRKIPGQHPPRFLWQFPAHTNAIRWSCEAIQEVLFLRALRSDENLLAGILCRTAKTLLWEILQNTICRTQQLLCVQGFCSIRHVSNLSVRGASVCVCLCVLGVVPLYLGFWVLCLHQETWVRFVEASKPT